MLRNADWLWDRELEARDNAACALEDRRNEIAAAVTFRDLIEELAEFTEPRGEEFMKGYRNGMTPGKHVMYVLVDQAFERIVERRLAGGE
jgi:hypothetical protein